MSPEDWKKPFIPDVQEIKAVEGDSTSPVPLHVSFGGSLEGDIVVGSVDSTC